MAAALELAAHLPVVGELAVMDHRDVVVGIGPVGMGGADVDIGFGRHAGMADAVGAAEPVELYWPATRAASPRSLTSSSALPMDRISVLATSST
jgi:hypothetical protein